MTLIIQRPTGSKLTLRQGFSPVGIGGDNVYEIEVSGTVYRVHVFTTVGESEFIAASPIPNLEYLVVAGGGGGGGNHSSGWAGGGGGGGGYRTFTEAINPGIFPVVVGAGGIGGTGGAITTNATKGGNSSFNGVVSTGGGIGGRSLGVKNGDSGGTGGSGGGGAGEIGLAGGGAGNEGGFTPVEGFAGGPNSANTNNPGTGGGAAGAGIAGNLDGAPTSVTNGVVNNISGISVTYSNGGSAQQTSPVTSPPNTGRGGDARNGISQSGLNGGSGIVIVRYAI